MLLEHLKALALHLDLGEKDVFFWFSTTGWMMWNMLVSGLLVGATVVLYDGSPAFPGLLALWKLAEEERISYFGTSAPYLLACQKAGVEPAKTHDLSAIRGLGTTGAPLPAAGFGWVYAHVSQRLLLGSVSGGSDVCTAFLLSCPLLPVHAGEIQCRGLGAKIEAFDAAGQSVTGEVGELVLSAPFPAMPVYFWGDSDGARFKDSYFSSYPGIWRHGDWLKLTASGAAVIYGRSDSTLEPRRSAHGHERILSRGRADPGDRRQLGGGHRLTVGRHRVRSTCSWCWRPAPCSTRALRRRIESEVRRELSPRHVPDQIMSVPAVPRTLNGKKLEIPVKRLLARRLGRERGQSRYAGQPDGVRRLCALAGELHEA